MTPTPLPPILYLMEALEIASEAPSGLRWKTRPREHFKSSRGWLMCRTRDAGNFAGNQVCGSDGQTRFMVKLNQRKFAASRIVYALAYGNDPWPKEVDHIDGNTSNNHPSNLRVASRSENASNKGMHSNNTSGIRGVTWCKRTKTWLAQIGKDKKTIFLGRFDSLTDAASARSFAETRIHGEFSGLSSRLPNLNPNLTPQRNAQATR